jgi:hypothetical protein
MTSKKQTPREEWRELPFNKKYKVSNYGRVSGPKATSFGTKQGNGYFCKIINNKNYRVHRLIMLAFFGESKLDVNHKNGIKSDNRLDNLEYVTRRQNQIHAFKLGLKKPILGERNGQSKLNKAKVKEIRSSKENNCAIARKHKVSEGLIRQIKLGVLWKEAAYEAATKGKE